MKIWGREPAVWVGLVAVAVQTLVAWGVDLTEAQQAGINAVAALAVGLVVAVMVARDRIVPAAAGLLVGVLQLAVAFGADFSQEQVASAGALLTAVLAAWLRTQVTAPVAADGSRVPKAPVAGR
ncbi:hypothetical protein BJF79_03560 [Actinomadura sp. CNU-125]|uniref:hypothetical protein n=1 Tax=Actinomadura sp. CNU-125 TaxID=1904961 RepID=UPI00095CAA93|nr:hypothetical protein [Actinomadura sp. CNU-125]OLT12989.1 hypothetical protein BJF79_03560 [Actinomadura sp. CNU-125]